MPLNSWNRVWPLAFASNMLLVICLLATGACTQISPPPAGDGGSGEFNNTTDPTNNGAHFVGSDACGSCHSGISAQHAVHGHSNQLNKIQGMGPVFPMEGTRAGVPEPPAGFEWTEIAYVIGGYTRRAIFVDLDGFVLTTGTSGIETTWNLAFPPNGNAPQFAEYEPNAAAPQPYGFSCFGCHTTGAGPQDQEAPLNQDNRPGIFGTWEEAGVQCEACHGPGSNHVPNTGARDIFVGISAQYCGKCHSSGPDLTVVAADGGFVSRYGQFQELLASGGHADFSCVTCHDPHVGSNYDRSNAIRNECSSCHSDYNMAIHEGLTFVRAEYTEKLSCVSCHMPFATRSATSASVDVVGDVGRMGDTKTHIFRINTDPADYQSFFNGDGTAVNRDTEGNAAVTMDFVCFRCHNGIGNAGEIDSLELASGVASGMHSIVRSNTKQRVHDPK